jgi:hypothetical protein
VATSSAARESGQLPIMLVQALALARRGLAVFPCGVRSKVPAGGHGHLEATTEPHRLRWWWKENLDYNIGIATGTVSGVWVLDVDGLEGETALRELDRDRSYRPVRGAGAAAAAI